MFQRTSVHSVNIRAFALFGPNSLHWPSQRSRPRVPELISQLSSPLGQLSASVHIPEQQFIGSTIRMELRGVVRKVDMRDVGRMFVQNSVFDEVIRRIGNDFVDINRIVMRTCCEEFLARGELNVADPFFGHFPLLDFRDFEILIQFVSPHRAIVKSDKYEIVIGIDCDTACLVAIFHIIDIDVGFPVIEQVVTQLNLLVRIPDAQRGIFN